MAEKAKKPAMRFAGFDDAWEQRKLGDVVDVCSGKDYKHLQEGTIPVYGTGGYMLSVNDALSYSDDAIGIGRKGTIDKPYILRAPFWTVDTLFYAVPKEKNDLDFTYAIFQKIDWKKKDESTGVPSLSKTTINEIDVMVACNEEQIHIGKFFSHLDALITLHQREHDRMLNVKKSMLEKMFPKDGVNVPEVRFAGFTDPWEERKLGEAFYMEIPNNTHSRAELNYEGCGVQNIHYGDVLIKFGAFIDAQHDDIPFITNSCIEDYKAQLLKDGDIIFADTAEDTTTGKAAEIGNIGEKFVVAGLHTIVCRPIEKKAKFYLGYYFNSNAFRNQLLPLMQGIKVLSLSRNNLSKTFIKYPPTKIEQSCIGEFFRRLDALMALHQRKAEKLKKMKKACLEKMFV